MAMTISMGDDLERDFTEVCREMGLSPSTAIGIFARAVVRERAIPYSLSVERAELALELSVADGIRRGMADVATGDLYTREEVRAMRTTWPCATPGGSTSGHHIA